MSDKKAKSKQALPPLPRAKRTKKTVPKPCECGCGDETRGGRFIPGHDSKLKAWMIRVERGLIKIADIEDEGTRNAVKKAMRIGGSVVEAKPKKAPKQGKPKREKSAVKPKRSAVLMQPVGPPVVKPKVNGPDYTTDHPRRVADPLVDIHEVEEDD